VVISVGATTRFDERAEFSGTGSALDVVAPGEDVPTVAAFSYGNSCDFFTGCSAATPIASGIASLLLSLDPLPTHQQVLDILTETADDLVGPPAEDTPGRDDFFGYGRVNLNRALLEVPEPARSFQMGAGAGFLALLAWACSARRRTAGRDRSCVRRGAC